MARDLTVLLDRLGAPEADLIGYSMGGVAAGLAEHGGMDGRVPPRAEVIAVLLADDPARVVTSPALPFRALADATGADRRALAAQITAAHRTPVPLDRITAETLILTGADDPFAAARRCSPPRSRVPGYARSRAIIGTRYAIRRSRRPSWASCPRRTVHTGRTLPVE
ncbi:alpha/beta fold hydrolase [Catenuloplanes indicus]|uniref:Pimeloyl-ACP methyl ester carboxylesterase n=1 Tax=Catenuloplanes indicus TaxID=137267 RepID=A0AAE3W5Z1_9ACTN|nr:hypothetical protein [Catenuloplanes indicus]MDQ0370528.1 pimeloyl-ACP methyl ester carboxylesterase [Catenuloplanes indicus]